MSEINQKLRLQLQLGDCPYLNPIYNSAIRMDISNGTDLRVFLNALDLIRIQIYNGEFPLTQLFPSTIRLILSRVSPYLDLSNFNYILCQQSVIPEIVFYPLVNDLSIYGYLLQPFM